MNLRPLALYAALSLAGFVFNIDSLALVFLTALVVGYPCHVALTRVEAERDALLALDDTRADAEWGRLFALDAALERPQSRWPLYVVRGDGA